MSNRKPQPIPTEELLARCNAALPFSDDAEKAFLSFLLQNPNRIAEANRDCPPSTFYGTITRTIYDALVYLHARFQPIDPITVANYLRDNDRLDAVGGSVMLSELYTFNFIQLENHFAFYRDTILEKHGKREMIRYAAELIVACREPEITVAAVTEEATSRLEHLRASTQNKADMLPHRPINAVIDSVLAKADSRAQNPGRLPGLSTGFATIDAKTGGMQRGRLFVIAGETSDGKSTLSQNFVESACDVGAHGVIYSYEMPDEEIAERMLCSRGEVSNESMMRGSFVRAEQDGLLKATNEIKNWNIALIDVADSTIESICRDIDRRTENARKADPNAELVACIDYLQLASTAENFRDNRERAVAHISKTAKSCAKRNKITIIMPSQLNDDGKVRESRAIAHDADVLLLIRKVKKKRGSTEDPHENDREIFCAKNRGGKKNWSCAVHLSGEYFKFNPRTA